MKVIVTNLHKEKSEINQWYKIGDIIDVRPYRHNASMYYEVVGWDGEIGGGNLDNEFWVKKENVEEYDSFSEVLDEIFET